MDLKLFRILFVLCFSLIGSVFAEEDNIIQVIRVIDANTLVLAGGAEVRILGSVAPSPFDSMDELSNEEKDKMLEIAYEAREFVKYLVEGKLVRLEVDPKNATPLGHRDKDGRILSYVWFTTPVYEQIPAWLVVDPKREDGMYDALLNAALIRAGYAQVDLTWPFGYVGRFLTLKEEAKHQKRGQWVFRENDDVVVPEEATQAEDEIKMENE